MYLTAAAAGDVISTGPANVRGERASSRLTTELVAGAFLCAARILLVLMINAYVHHWDTGAYVNAAHKPLTGLLFDRMRSAGYPLLLKLVGYHEGLLIVLQTIVASFSWLFFAFTLASFFRDRRVRLPAFLGFYLLSFSVPILQWDYVLYAESVSLALFALVASFLLRYGSAGGLGDLRRLVALAVPFVLMRDSNLFAYAVVALFVFFAKRTPSSATGRPGPKLALVLAAVVLLPLVSVVLSDRGTVSVQNVILRDIAMQPALVDEMASRYGMPRSVVACAGLLIWDCDKGRVEELNAWAMRSGRAWYLRFLLAHPAFAGRILARSWLPALGGAEVTRYGDFKQIRQEHIRQPNVEVVPLTALRRSYYEPSRAVAHLFYGVTFGGVMARLRPAYGVVLSLVPFVALTVLVVASKKTRRTAATSLVPAVFLALAAISQLPVVILSVDAVARHAVLASVAMNYLALYLAFFCLSLAVRPARDRDGEGPRLYASV